MVSKRRFSYRWRLFVPIVAMMWLIIAVVMVFQYKREVSYRTTTIHKQLALINSRILDAYEHGVDLDPFMRFLEHYFDNSMFDEVVVNVYDKTGALLYSIDSTNGESPQEDMSRASTMREFRDAEEHGVGIAARVSGNSMFYFTARKSNDGNIYVHTAMPLTVSISDSLKADDLTFWSIVVLLVIGVTVIAYMTTSYLSRNIKMLNEFAKNANNDNVKFDESKFPHNELGDISREIVRLYRERGEAMKKSEREHAIALHAVEEKTRVKRQLTNNINHELKTPVGVIRGYLETVLSSDDMDDATRTYFLQRAQDNVGRLCNLLNDVSAMTRLEDGSGNIPMTEVNFHDLVFTVDNDMTAAGELKNMTFSFDLPLDCIVRGNSTLLVGAVSNLIKNAVHHSHGTAITLNLLVESDKYYTFSFRDNGRGVGEEHIPHLFERFYRIDAGRSRKAGGTGLGLPIVKNTIEAMGGTISVHNNTEGGLEFMFTLQKWTGK